MGVTTENGKTLREARGEVEKAADFLDYYAGHAREAYGSLVHDVRPDTRTSFQREPIGVVLAITPWILIAAAGVAIVAGTIGIRRFLDV